MRLVSLNCWAGRLHQPLFEFIKNYSATTDIFCFQEVFANSAGETRHFDYRANLLSEISEILPEYDKMHLPSRIGTGIDRKPVTYDLAFGTAMFVRKQLPHDFDSALLLSASDKTHAYHGDKSLQLVRMSGITIATMHGLWFPKIGKIDTPERIIQSNAVLQVLEKEQGELILCGDLNLNPDTKSLKILEGPLRNLVSEHEVRTTRSSHYKKPEKFADYTFVSEGIKVSSFEVLGVEVSDHLPMILDFELA